MDEQRIELFFQTRNYNFGRRKWGHSRGHVTREQSPIRVCGPASSLSRTRPMDSPGPINDEVIADSEGESDEEVHPGTPNL
jgi:hypothetical protein